VRTPDRPRFREGKGHSAASGLVAGRGHLDEEALDRSPRPQVDDDLDVRETRLREREPPAAEQ
jgi:hypothetical protein